MASYLSKWMGGEFLRKFEKEYANNLKRAAVHLSNETKKALSDPYPPASTGGEEPHRRTGELRRSITWEVDERLLKGRVGTNKIYGRFLELGTSEMEKRPFLVPTLTKERRTIRAILSKKTDVK